MVLRIVNNMLLMLLWLAVMIGSVLTLLRLPFITSYVGSIKDVDTIFFASLTGLAALLVTAHGFAVRPSCRCRKTRCNATLAVVFTTLALVFAGLGSIFSMIAASSDFLRSYNETASTEKGWVQEVCVNVISQVDEICCDSSLHGAVVCSCVGNRCASALQARRAFVEWFVPKQWYLIAALFAMFLLNLAESIRACGHCCTRDEGAQYAPGADKAEIPGGPIRGKWIPPSYNITMLPPPPSGPHMRVAV